MHTDRDAVESRHGGRRQKNGRDERLERLLTLHELAQLLSLSDKTIRRMVAARRLPCIRLGRVLRFRPADLLRFVEARKE